MLTLQEAWDKVRDAYKQYKNLKLYAADEFEDFYCFVWADINGTLFYDTPLKCVNKKNGDVFYANTPYLLSLKSKEVDISKLV